MKKTKLPGENISLKTKKTEEPSVMEWINAQTNLMDSIRYLIENELKQNGVRNLQVHIPAERSFSTPSVPAQLPMSSDSNRSVRTDTAAEKREAIRPIEDDIDDEDIESWT